MNRLEIKQALKTSYSRSFSVSRITRAAIALGFEGPDFTDDQSSEIMASLLNAETETAEKTTETVARARLSDISEPVSVSAPTDYSSSELTLGGQLAAVSAGFQSQYQQIDQTLTMVEQQAGEQVADRIAGVSGNIAGYTAIALADRMDGATNLAEVVLGSFSFGELGGAALRNFTPAAALPQSR